MTPQQQETFSDVFDELGKSLDITPKEYEDAVKSYEFVGRWLAGEDSELSPYEPEILPQGSFILGTMIRPYHDCHLDIDLVCRLIGKRGHWTPYHLKHAVGDRLKAHGKIDPMLRRPDGRRCWTLDYSEGSQFHMDILPAIVSRDYEVLLEKSFSATFEETDIEALAIRITDKEHESYTVATNPADWLMSNMFGYAAWFKKRCAVNLVKGFCLNESIKPVPHFETKKMPLQRIVQILKRHRDMMFKDDEDKPISIIITTLAARAYQGQSDVMTGLMEVLDIFEAAIEYRQGPDGQGEAWIENPVNEQENFADKWVEHPEREKKFRQWLSCARRDISRIVGQEQWIGIRESLNTPFGSKIVDKLFTNLSATTREMRQNSRLYMSVATGMLGASGRTQVKDHKFYGNHGQ